MVMNRVVVTGGAGYIGSHTLMELLALDHEVCVLDSFANSSPKALVRVSKLAGRKFAVESADIRDEQALYRIFNAFKPDAVIHFAGLKAVAEGETKPVDYYDVNVAGTLNLLKAMTASNCSRIIFSSSATVYGDPDYLPLDETHPCRPASVYGRSKYFAEQVLFDWARATPRRNAIVLRYFNPVGAHESGEIGEDPQDIPNNLMPFIAQVASGLRQQLAIYGDDYETRDGTGLRDYIHVSDLARAHVAALDYASRGQVGADVFNLGSGNGATVREMLAAYEVACGRSLPSKVVSRRAGDVAASVADPSKAEKLLDWRTRHTLEEMCSSSWNWQSKNPTGYRAAESLDVSPKAHDAV
ncbi:UDP-glucose 4-epimerase [Camelimonas fluminis]|uniref:UDP-glucose 4-epimerase n=2 Tax=Camelimonas fluminis TaxID=1576911 RepID=A0ABV7UI25_9HYPH|nr:UDP-glucose 4-epimerase [Camelimonas fluminis]